MRMKCRRGVGVSQFWKMFYRVFFDKTFYNFDKESSSQQNIFQIQPNFVLKQKSKNEENKIFR